MRYLLRIPIIIRLIGWIFAHMSFMIPITRLRETPNLIAFQHPSPGYKFHVLIVPKREAASLAQLDPADTAFLSDLYPPCKVSWTSFTYRRIVSL